MKTDHEAPPASRRLWQILASVIAAILFWMATSDAVYESTSPREFSGHVVLRKAYSIAAFALVGFTADKALGASTRPIGRAALLVAIYSAAIEIAQSALGSNEGLGWNAFDVGCGAVGGALGVMIARLIRSRRKA
jgi:hypothetical protein